MKTRYIHISKELMIRFPSTTNLTNVTKHTFKD
jgi:hypothetical protein